HEGEEENKKHRHDKIRQGHRQHGGKGAEIIDWTILVHRGTDAEGQSPHERHGERHSPQVQRHWKGLANNLVHGAVLVHVRTAKIPVYGFSEKDHELLPDWFVETILLRHVALCFWTEWIGIVGDGIEWAPRGEVHDGERNKCHS